VRPARGSGDGGKDVAVDMVNPGSNTGPQSGLKQAGEPNGPSGERLGLRERKKRATRQALHGAALRLVAARGFDDVTIEDIAAAADVSPRTFFNYFGSKEDVIVNPDPEWVDRLKVLLEQHTADESPLTVMEDVLVAQLDEVTDRREEWLLRLRLVREIPALTPRHLAAFDAMERALVEDVAHRTGRDPASDLYPVLLGIAAMAAMRPAIPRWGAGDGRTSLPDLVHEAFAALRAGLGTPPG
jgi:AcrR family transcriptional regulator